jgi:hypothetical protein
MRACGRTQRSGPHSFFAGIVVLAAFCSVCACTLITDVDREAIPRPIGPTFPEVDAGGADASIDPEPAQPGVDAGPDASAEAGVDGGPQPDAAGADAAVSDAAADAG